MSRQALLAAAAKAHYDWTDQFADGIPADPADSKPHGKESDYAEHHSDRSAPADVDDLLSEHLLALMQSGTEEPGGVNVVDDEEPAEQ